MSRFALVPIEALQDTRLSHRDLKVLIALYSFADKAGQCYPTRQAISTLTKIRITTISQITTRLQTLGWLSKVGKGGFSAPSHYQITVPDLSTVLNLSTVPDLSTGGVLKSSTGGVLKSSTRKEQTSRTDQELLTDQSLSDRPKTKNVLGTSPESFSRTDEERLSLDQEANQLQPSVEAPPRKPKARKPAFTPDELAAADKLFIGYPHPPGFSRDITRCRGNLLSRIREVPKGSDQPRGLETTLKVLRNYVRQYQGRVGFKTLKCVLNKEFFNDLEIEQRTSADIQASVTATQTTSNLPVSAFAFFSALRYPSGETHYAPQDKVGAYVIRAHFRGLKSFLEQCQSSSMITQSTARKTFLENYSHYSQHPEEIPEGYSCILGNPQGQAVTLVAPYLKPALLEKPNDPLHSAVR